MADNLTVVATSTSALNTNVADLNAAIASGGLNVTDVSDIEISQGNVTAAGAVSLKATTGNITGTGVIDAGSSNNVTLTAAGEVTLNTHAEYQIRGNVLNITSGDDANVDTDVSALVANVTGNLTLIEANGLNVGSGAGSFVNTTGNLSITLNEAGSLSGAGSINAGGNVSVELQAAGNVNSTGTVTGNVLDVHLLQNGNISLTTSANEAVLRVDGPGSIAINEINGLTANVIRTTQGDVTVNLAAGSLSIADEISSGVANAVVLNASAGAINSTAADGIVFGSNLTITARDSSEINTSVTSIVSARVTKAGASLTIRESDDTTYQAADGLTILAGSGVVTDAGAITIHVLDGNLTAIGTVTALNTASGTIANSGNVTINVANGSATFTQSAGQIVGNVLSVAVEHSSTLNTNVTRIQDFGSFAINNNATDDVSATAAFGTTPTSLTYQLAETNINVATFTATLKYDDNTAGGDAVAYNLAGNADGTITFTADTGKNVTELLSASLNATTGLLTLNFDQSPLGTLLAANYLRTLRFNAVRDLVIGSGDLTSNGNADIVLNLVGNLTSAGAGNIVADAGNANVTIIAASGGIDTTGGPSTINASLLTVTARDAVNINTTIGSLAANVIAGTLAVVETDDLSIAAGNVVAAGAITLNAVGKIDGAGFVRAGSGAANVQLIAGNLSLTTANQVSGNVLTVNVTNTSVVNTNVTSLKGKVTGSGENLNVTEGNGLNITAGNDVTLTDGALTLSLTNGNLVIAGNIAAGAAGEVSLAVTNGAVTMPSGKIAASNLTVTARDASSVNTSVANLSANVVVGGLTVTELNDLDIGLGATGLNNVVAAGGVAITAGGNITTGANGIINGGSGNVSLTTASGGITLNDVTGQIAGNLLTIASRDDVNVNTAVTSLVASVANASGGKLTVNELNDLTVSPNVTTVNGVINITVGGNLSLQGAVKAGSTGANDVNLTANNGSISGAGLITANILTTESLNATSLNAAVNMARGTVTGPGQSFTLTNSKNITLDDVTSGTNSAISTVNGSIAVNVTSGNISINDVVTAGTGNVTLTAAAGNVSTTATGKVVGNQLVVTAQNSSTLNTAVAGLTANITGSSQSLTVNDDDGLAIAGAGVRTKAGIVTINAGTASTGTLTINNPINSSGANINLRNDNGGIIGTATITANVLTINASGDSALSTNVTQVQGLLTGSRTLSLNQVAAANGLRIGTANLNVGSGTLNLNIANGSLTGTTVGNGNLIATGGQINVNAASGNIGDASTNITINAGATGGVSLTAVSGGITLNNVANQVSGGVLTLTAARSSSLKTDVTSIRGSITGSGNTLTVVDHNSLTVASAGLATTDGNLSIQTGAGANSNLVLAGTVTAGSRNVTLNAPNGTISGSGLITGSNLTLNSSGNAAVSTNVANLTATTAGNALNVVELNNLSISSVNTAGGNATITLGGNLTGSGTINAGSGDVVLSSTGGGVTLTAAQAIKANNLTITALNTSTVNTTVANVAANVTGAGQSFTIRETNDLAVAAAGVATSGGNVTVNLAVNLTGSGRISAGAGNVTINSTGGNVTPTGLITAGTLVLNASTTSAVNTSVTSIQGKVTAGGLTVNEAADLAIAASGVTVQSALVVNVLNGSLTGTGRLNATDAASGNVTLNVPQGSITLTSSNQVSAGNVLSITANGTSALNTSAANLAATIRNGGLTIVEANNVKLATGGINTSLANGSVALTLTTGSLDGVSNAINAGTGNVSITAGLGNVTLNGTARQIVGNVLTIAARGDTSLNTAVNTLNATLTTPTGTGDLSVTDVDSLAIDRAVTTNGNVTVNVGTNSLTVNNITAARKTKGNVTLTAGNVTISGVGITANNVLDLTNVAGTVNVTSGVLNSSSVVNQSSGARVNWVLSGGNPLATIITNSNFFRGKSQINVTTPTTVNLTSSLPRITSDLQIQGNNNLTINAVTAESGFTFAGSNAGLSQVTMNNFSGTAITLLPGAIGTTINNVAVVNSVTGLQASGLLTGSTVSNSSFNGSNRANAVGIRLGGTDGLSVTRNTVSNATIGLQATGRFATTVVQTNSFDRLSRYGISLSAASAGSSGGLLIGSDVTLDLSQANTMTNITASGSAGLYAIGFCTNTVVRKTQFANVTTRLNVTGSRNLTIVN